jgi:hypothetical protein
MLRKSSIYFICFCLVTACTNYTALSASNPNLKQASSGKALRYRAQPDCTKPKNGTVVSETPEEVTFSSGETVKRADLCLVEKGEVVLNPFYYAYMVLISPILLIGSLACISNAGENKSQCLKS